MKTIHTGLAVLALVTLSTTSLAQDESGAAHFQEGKRLYDAKQFEAACKELATSDKLTPSVATLGLLASCHEQLGKVATAAREYRETATRAHLANDNREAFAREYADKLEPSVPKLIVKTAPDENAVVALRVDGEAAELGKPLEVDPGTHAVVATAPGRTELTRSIVIVRAQVETVVLERMTPGSPGPSAVFDTPPPLPPNTQRTAGLVIGGVGVAGIVVGGVFGGLTFAKKSSLSSDCPNKVRCDPNEISAGNTLGAVSTIGFGVGAAALVAGGVLFFTAKTPGGGTVALAPAAGPTHAGASLSGAF